MPPAQAQSTPAAEPALAIVGGNPSAEEIAAVVTVLSARLKPAGQARAGGLPRLH